MNILYKYRDFSTRTNEIITDKKIWLAKPSTLNDPLECQIEEFERSKLNKYAQKSKEVQLAGFLFEAMRCHKCKDDFFGLKGRRLKQFISKIGKLKDQNRKYKLANKLMIESGTNGLSDPIKEAKSISEQLQNIGVFSLSEDPCNMLMWSHYGNNHKGVALGFSQLPNSKLSDSDFCCRVNYKDDVNQFDFEEDHLSGLEYRVETGGRLSVNGYVPLKDEQVQIAMFTKTKDWEYEKEWRYIEEKYGSYDFPSELSEVVFGLSSDETSRNDFIRLCKNNIANPVQFKKIVRIKGTTKLGIELIKI
ncbi:DUF2971 domain-containing protein [Paraneptunicella aestuarii]|uniref:DUF2971 domain-containing protein n=1 Tax=Paraneptunicella aestuarii TaxID=2831148 RepID=UPI001E3E8BB3|nr:DUF2971 domain-containing protein [Paraneptunicella aestuarii]UAA37516.1 DUF2971 domain-containing protein [Paraneptunicella aestuarii]